MSAVRTTVVTAMAGLAVLLTGCGQEDAGGDAQQGIVAADGDAAATPTLTPPATVTPTATPGDARDGLGEMILIEVLDVRAAEYPLPDAPTQVEASSVDELAQAYATVPGIDEVLAGLDDTALAPGERLFAYLVNACRTDDVRLMVRGDQVPMIVTGNATLRCAPPTTLVVWVVGDDVPADAVPAQAIQK